MSISIEVIEPYSEPELIEIVGEGPQGVKGAKGDKGDQGIPGVVIVNHGTNASTARPTSAIVYWKGTVRPTNALDTDWWLNA